MGNTNFRRKCVDAAMETTALDENFIILCAEEGSKTVPTAHRANAEPMRLPADLSIAADPSIAVMGQVSFRLNPPANLASFNVAEGNSCPDLM